MHNSLIQHHLTNIIIDLKMVSDHTVTNYVLKINQKLKKYLFQSIKNAIVSKQTLCFLILANYADNYTEKRRKKTSFRTL